MFFVLIFRANIELGNVTPHIKHQTVETTGYSSASSRSSYIDKFPKEAGELAKLAYYDYDDIMMSWVPLPGDFASFVPDSSSIGDDILDGPNATVTLAMYLKHLKYAKH